MSEKYKKHGKFKPKAKAPVEGEASSSAPARPSGAGGERKKFVKSGGSNKSRDFGTEVARTLAETQGNLDAAHEKVRQLEEEIAEKKSVETQHKIDMLARWSDEILDDARLFHTYTPREVGLWSWFCRFLHHIIFLIILQIIIFGFNLLAQECFPQVEARGLILSLRLFVVLLYSFALYDDFRDCARLAQVDAPCPILSYETMYPLGAVENFMALDMRWDALSQVDLKHKCPRLCVVREVSWTSETACQIWWNLRDPNSNGISDTVPGESFSWLRRFVEYWFRVERVYTYSAELLSQLSVPSAMDPYLDRKDVLERLRMIARTTQTINQDRFALFRKNDIVQITLNMAMCYWCERKRLNDRSGFFLYQ